MKEEASWTAGVAYGLSSAWHENGLKSAEVNFIDGKLNGRSIGWYANGQKKSELIWIDSKLLSGKKWKPNGEVCPITNIKDGNGVRLVYNEDGSEKERFTFKDGVQIETNEQSNEKTDAGISPEELDKLLENSIGESPSIPVPPPPLHEPPHSPLPLQRLPRAWHV